jgi:signal transduction histidine kinase
MPDQATLDLSASHLPAPVLAEVLAHLDFTVLDCPGDNSFCIVGPVPDWLTQLYPAVLTNRHGSRPQDQFPFLENFLIDAENFWRTKQPGPFKSGAWTEQAANGTSYQLEASAMRIGAHKLLLIERLGRGFAEKQSALQQARETRLDYQQLTKEIQKKEILLHCIVHDLAGPLTAIKGSLDVLAFKDFTQEEQEFLEIGQQQVAKQERLIQDILDVFAAELDALEAVSSDPNTAPDVSRCVQDVVHTLAPAFSISQIDLQLAPDTDWTAAWRVVADQSPLERVIANLLDNALRYSPRNSQVTVSMLPDGTQVRITVEDQGPGVAADMQAILFEKFVHRKDLFGKAGLGLYFCRMMVERWGGTI